MQEVDRLQNTITQLIGDMNELKYDIKQMIAWSDRIGSDEIHELNRFIVSLNQTMRKTKE
tara:strand:- start:9984 stop:10163 length:180 start_codon:yes stop_codon:yes gene_type:complete